jgi:hypothetical protein
LPSSAMLFSFNSEMVMSTWVVSIIFSGMGSCEGGGAESRWNGEPKSGVAED